MRTNVSDDLLEVLSPSQLMLVEKCILSSNWYEILDFINDLKQDIEGFPAELILQFSEEAGSLSHWRLKSAWLRFLEIFPRPSLLRAQCIQDRILNMFISYDFDENGSLRRDLDVRRPCAEILKKVSDQDGYNKILAYLGTVEDQRVKSLLEDVLDSLSNVKPC